MGATRSRTETQGSPRAHTRARTGTHSTTGYTHVGRSRGGPERGSQGGAAGRHTRTPTPTPRSLSRRAPAKACATGGGSSPPRPAQAGRSARRAGERGVVLVEAATCSEGKFSQRNSVVWEPSVAVALGRCGSGCKQACQGSLHAAVFPHYSRDSHSTLLDVIIPESLREQSDLPLMVVRAGLPRWSHVWKVDGVSGRLSTVLTL